MAQPQLASHLASFGRRVFSYSSSEFADMVYGGRNRKLASQQDFCVFRLEHPSDASVFQRVLTRTLRLDKLRSSEVKDYLLQIFRRDLPDASIDFKAEWDKAFADLNAERSQYLAAVRLQATLGELEQKQEARLVLRGKLLCWRPLIDAALGQWQQHYETRQQTLQHELAQCDTELQRLREQDMQSAGEKKECELEQQQLRQQSEQLRALQQRFALIPERALLEARRRELQEQRDALVVRIGQAQSRTPAAIERELARIERESAQLAQQAEALEKKVRSAVVNVAACLRELRDGLFAFKRRMREFNRKISGRQLSDLAVFKIEPEDETLLVEAIELLINTAATVDSGETFELFNQQSVLDDEQINRAKTLLIEEGNARHGLRVADLFRLRFWVGKADREPEAFDDLDSAASNGTVLMAKLVTGLAMLHLMQDQRRPIQGICYLDEALALDARNQRSLIDTAAEFGFSLIFASPALLTTVRYCVPIHTRNGSNQISRHSWQVIEPLDA